MGFFLVAGSVTAQAAQSGDFEYDSSGTEITITGYTRPGGAVTVLKAISNLPVTSIGYATFHDCTSLGRWYAAAGRANRVA